MWVKTICQDEREQTKKTPVCCTTRSCIKTAVLCLLRVVVLSIVSSPRTVARMAATAAAATAGKERKEGARTTSQKVPFFKVSERQFALHLQRMQEVPGTVVALLLLFGARPH